MTCCIDLLYYIVIMDTPEKPDFTGSLREQYAADREERRSQPHLWLSVHHPQDLQANTGEGAPSLISDLVSDSPVTRTVYRMPTEDDPRTKVVLDPESLIALRGLRDQR